MTDRSTQPTPPAGPDRGPGGPPGRRRSGSQWRWTPFLAIGVAFLVLGFARDVSDNRAMFLAVGYAFVALAMFEVGRGEKAHGGDRPAGDRQSGGRPGADRPYGDPPAPERPGADRPGGGELGDGRPPQDDDGR